MGTRVVTGNIVPLLLAMLYTAIVVSVFARSGGGFSTLAVAALSNRWMLLAGWVHLMSWFCRVFF
ncbi:MAG TPA: hypothetical protein VK789_12980 [Bryobacteraceae bacterium]|nr:hypothetical protein [Bryobacteraceae bacterium]